MKPNRAPRIPLGSRVRLESAAEYFKPENAPKFVRRGELLAILERYDKAQKEHRVVERIKAFMKWISGQRPTPEPRQPEERINANGGRN